MAHREQKWLENDSIKGVNISAELYNRRQEATNMLDELKFIWDGHFGTIKTIKHIINLQPGSLLSIHTQTEPDCQDAFLRIRESQDYFEGLHRACAVLVGVSLRLSVEKCNRRLFYYDYLHLNEVMPRMDECIDSIRDSKIFRLGRKYRLLQNRIFRKLSL